MLSHSWRLTDRQSHSTAVSYRRTWLGCASVCDCLITISCGSDAGHRADSTGASSDATDTNAGARLTDCSRISRGAIQFLFSANRRISRAHIHAFCCE